MTTANEIIERYKKGEKFADVTLHNADFTGLNLRGIVLKHCDFSFSSFSACDLTDADFSGCNLAGCNFSGAILRNTNFENASFTRATVSKALIDNTNFRRASFMFAHLCGNDLMKADLTNATLDWSCLIDTKLTEQQLSAVPKDAILSMSEVHAYKTGTALYAARPGKTYSAPFSSYSSIQGEKREYKSEVSPEREINPAFWRRKKGEHKEM